MFRRYPLVALVAAATALTGTPIRAESFDSGKKLVTKLLATSSAKATAATVRIRCDNKDAILEMLRGFLTPAQAGGKCLPSCWYAPARSLRLT